MWAIIYTTYKSNISVDLAQHEIFRAKIGKGGLIKLQKPARVVEIFGRKKKLNYNTL